MSVETVEVNILDKKMREIRSAGKNMETERVAVLAALNICHELFTRGKQTEDTSKFAQALQLLIGKIDRVIAG